MNRVIAFFGAVFWIVLAGARLRQAMEGSLVAILLAAQSGLAAYLLLRQSPVTEQLPWSRIPKYQYLTAWISTLMPLTLRVENSLLYGELLASIGLILTLWAMISLSRSFGIAPADRGLVQVGPYRLVRHPMYAGELLSVAGALLGSVTSFNIAIFILLVISMFLRIHWEEAIIAGFGQYAREIRWRLVPGVW